MIEVKEISLWVLGLIVVQMLSGVSISSKLQKPLASVGVCLFVLISSYLYWTVGFFINISPWFSWISLILAAVMLFKTFGFKKLYFDGFESSVFWIGFLIALGIRAYSPTLDLGEKYADFMILQSTINATEFPPKDYWLSPYDINYYYYSHLLFVPWIKCLSIRPEVAFNLITVTIFALMGSLSVSLLSMLTQKRRVMLCGALMSTLIANWAWINELIKKKWHGFYWWDSSRAITNTITEFPFFSFLLGDLHPHFTSIPWLYLTLFFVILVYQSKYTWTRFQLCCFYFCFALSIGAHYPLNPWQLPLVALMVSMVLHKKPKMVVMLGLMALVLYLPFWLSFARPQATSGLVYIPRKDRSSWFEFCLHWAPFLYFFFISAFIEFKRKKDFNMRHWFWLLCFTLLAWLWVGPAWSVLVLLSGVLILTKVMDLSSLEGQLYLLFVLLLAFCELYSVDFTYGENFIRINTVFKFYMLAWWLVSLLLPLVMDKVGFFSGSKSMMSLLALAASLSLVYPVRAVLQRGAFQVSFFPSLDGMKTWDVDFPGEREAIEWIRKSTRKEDVFFEVYGDGYMRFARVSTFSGRPSVMGWLNHEQIWRSDGFYKSKSRIDDIEALYTNPSTQSLQAFFEKYNVKYVFVGEMEKSRYPEPMVQALKKYPVSFSNAKVEIFNVKQ